MSERAEARDAAAAVLRLAGDQGGVVARWQALALGMTAHAINHRLAKGRWRRMFAGRRRAAAYATFTGPPGPDALVWAALLSCGPGAVLSHESAAWLYGLRSELDQPIHVTLPVGRKVRPPRGVRVSYSSRLNVTVHPVRRPPRTRVEETVVDLTQRAADPDAANAVIAEAVRRGITTHGRIIAAIRMRIRLHWRRELLESCGEVGEGQHTLLEIRYVRNIERPHGLPEAVRQARVKADGRCIVVDGVWPAYKTRLELDGQRGHTGDGVFRDVWRDNQAAIRGDMPLRLGWSDVNTRFCHAAAVIAKVLIDRGWEGWVDSCGVQCTADATLRRLAGENIA